MIADELRKLEVREALLTTTLHQVEETLRLGLVQRTPSQLLVLNTPDMDNRTPIESPPVAYAQRLNDSKQPLAE